jgi:hypothetical protein
MVRKRPFEYIGIGERIILKCGDMTGGCGGLNWFRIGTSGGLL